MIIFSFCILKPVQGTFRIEYDQRVIIKLLLTEEADARDIVDRRQSELSEHAYKLRTAQFWITEV
jgi:hypothetical protein